MSKKKRFEAFSYTPRKSRIVDGGKISFENGCPLCGSRDFKRDHEFLDCLKCLTRFINVLTKS